MKKVDFFERLANKIKSKTRNLWSRLKAYLKRLIFPLYLFPIKIITYTAYYLIKSLLKFIWAFISLVFEAILFPFRSLKNFLKSIFILIILAYLTLNLFVVTDYLIKEYGFSEKMFCGIWNTKSYENNILRIVGGYSEGSGFFIEPNKVITNFHVIDGEPSPKIIFPDGHFETPVKMVGDKIADLAILETKEGYEKMVMPLPDKLSVYEDESLFAYGYPLGTEINGKATKLKGKFKDYKKIRGEPMSYIQTDMSLVEGMSGGPMTSVCGEVYGINTMSLSGVSLFIDASYAKSLIPSFTDKDITKVELDPGASPEEAVKAFYTHLKTRNMEEGFKLLSKEYLKKTNFEEWTSRFSDVLDVDILQTKADEMKKDTVFIKFMTKVWKDEEVSHHYYEGTWQTVFEDGVYKMLKSNIKEVSSPKLEWFWEES
jgi:hypothetical protein